MKKTPPIDFTKKNPRRATLVTALIIAAVILLGALSFVALLAVNDFDLSKFFGTRAPEETTAEQVSEETTAEISTAEAFSDDSSVNFLLICSDSEKNLDFCDVISLSYAENVIRIKPVSPELTLEYRGGGYTLEKLFGLFSAGAVSEALTNKGMSISRTVSVDETGFKMIMQRLGSVDILLTAEVNYSVDAIKYSFPAGTQTMTSDTLLKYMKYAAVGDALLKVQAQALAQIVRTHFTAENIERGEEFFASLINLVDSDISAFDYTENRGRLSAFLSGKPSVNAVY